MSEKKPAQLSIEQVEQHIEKAINLCNNRVLLTTKLIDIDNGNESEIEQNLDDFLSLRDSHYADLEHHMDQFNRFVSSHQGGYPNETRETLCEKLGVAGVPALFSAIRHLIDLEKKVVTLIQSAQSKLKNHTRQIRNNRILNRIYTPKTPSGPAFFDEKK